MQAVILIGIQATGKSTFYKERFFNSHVRISMDLLRTRHREKVFLQTCLETLQPFVIDNTNPAKEDRKRYIELAKSKGYRIIGYYFESKVHPALVRNANRPEGQRIPAPGIFGTLGRLELPTRGEGFDELYYVRIAENGSFQVENWNDEI